jgi:formamidopyrimidine-DNA glycosylase
MPELPEVEVLRRSLDPYVVGAAIESVRVWNTNLREPVRPRSLWACKGRVIQATRRRAKYLLLDLEGGRTVVIHLGMSGRLTLASAQAPTERHEHVSIFLDSGFRLRFSDARRFGLVFVQATERLDADPHFAHLGLEPLDGTLDGEVLRGLARGRRAPVKSFLMDGRQVVGIGNIYAAEALYRAGIHPRRSVARIAAARWHLLARAVVETLGDAVEQGGTTLNDFADAMGQSGYFKVSLSVYDRAAEPCRRCGRKIRRIVQSGRSTFYCPGCQR